MIGDADFAVERRERFDTALFARGTGTDWDETIREPGNCVYDPDDADASRRWKLYYTGKDTSNDSDVGVAYSADGRTGWTKYPSNPVVSLAEDPYIALNKDGTLHRDSGGLMHMFTEEKFSGGVPEQNGINHYTSSDGLSWTADPANPVMEPPASSAWDDQDVTSPVVWWDDAASKFYLLYEGRGAGTQGSVGLAWSTDGSTWTRSPENPIIDGTTGEFGDTSIVPDDFHFDGTTWFIIGHGYTSPASYTMGKWSCSVADPEDWTAADWTEGPGTNPFDSGTSTIMSFSGPLWGYRWVYLDGGYIYEHDTVGIWENTFVYADAVYFGSTAVDKVFYGENPQYGPSVDDLLWQWRFEADSIALADGASVATWPDSSGNGRDATQATSGNRPVFSTSAYGGVGGVSFSGGTAQALVTPAIAALSQPSTVWIVGYTAAATNRVLLDGLSSGNRMYVGRPAGSTVELYVGATAGVAANPESACILTFVVNGASSNFYRNGGSDLLSANPGSHTLTGLTIGNRFSGSNSCGGVIGFVGVVNEAQNLDDLNLVGEYLAEKYGLTWTTVA